MKIEGTKRVERGEELVRIDNWDAGNRRGVANVHGPPTCTVDWTITRYFEAIQRSQNSDYLSNLGVEVANRTRRFT